MKFKIVIFLTDTGINQNFFSIHISDLETEGIVYGFSLFSLRERNALNCCICSVTWHRMLPGEPFLRECHGGHMSGRQWRIVGGMVLGFIIIIIIIIIIISYHGFLFSWYFC
jgi:hypothetical protein